MNRPRGHTLIELAVTMTAGSSLMILAIGLLHQSMTLASTAQRRADQDRTLGRLATEFRNDVHRAKSCEPVSQQLIRLTVTDDSVITYEVRPDGVSRYQQQDGRPARRESFPFSATTSATIQTLPQPQRVVLTLAAGPQHDPNRLRVDRHVVAVVGRLLAHQHAEVSP